jgi:hypothetical protein
VVASVANAAAPILGDVAGVLLGQQTDQEAKDAVLGIVAARGVAAVLCAIDRVVADLGGPTIIPQVGTQPSLTARGVMRGMSLRNVVEAAATPAK